MTTGAYWNTDNPAKPWGPLDIDEELDIPWDWSSWLADAGTSYASHTFSCQTPLEVAQSSQQNGIVTGRVRVATGGDPTRGHKYAVTCHLLAADGQKKDQTLYFKIVEA